MLRTRTGSLSTLALALSLAWVAQAAAQSPGASLVPADGGASATKHFDTLGKTPSTFTLEIRKGLQAELPFADKRRLRGSEARLHRRAPYTKIMADAGHVAWDMAAPAGS